ncbi:coiled-coil domain-containing protein 15 [Brachyhypopomus gauderio]|uniref:coiled-coil domain-containing protein 15 n=1 Tax=Brachyhypopomus gauderio TaxID=698409 RepID=UPI0040438316
MYPSRNVKRSDTNPKPREKDGGNTLMSKNRRKAKENTVLAERNPAVVAVGAWVETGDVDQEHPAVRALLTEELQEGRRREKEERLRQFQDAVRRRVSHQARVRKQRQLHKTYQMAERESRAVQQTSTAAQRLAPRTSQFPSWPPRELAVRSPGSRWVEPQDVTSSSDDTNECPSQLSQVMRQVRRRLAGRQTVQDGEELSGLPGGKWKVSPARDKPVSCVGRAVDDEEDEEESDGGLGEQDEISLAGQHDRPLRMQGHSSKTVAFQNDPVGMGLPRGLHPIGLPGGTNHQSAWDLWPGAEQEELKRQRQSQFLMYRRLFMDMEREQVKEQQRHRKHLRRIASIKAQKELLRREEERRLEEEEGRDVAERERLALQRLLLEEEEETAQGVKRRAEAEKVKETTRYVEALRVQMKERLEQEGVELPPLCCCGDGFWDSHPDTCANNCPFYHNPKGYAQALYSVLLSCDPAEGCAGHRSRAWRVAPVSTL